MHTTQRKPPRDPRYTGPSLIAVAGCPILPSFTLVLRPIKKWAAKDFILCRRPSLGFLEGVAVVRFLENSFTSKLDYCNSLVTSCCTLLACASAAMPVWLRISYFDMFDVAEA